MNSKNSPAHPATQLVLGGRDRDTLGFVNPPLVRGSTVLHDSVADMKARVAARLAGADEPIAYGIYGGPTHQAFYDALNVLEGGHRSWALPSGLTACAIALQAFVGSGDHVLVPDSVYGPVRRFCNQTLRRFGVTTTYYDPCSGAEIERLFTPATRMLWLESPGSHTFEMQDVPLLAAIARARGAFSAIDNTWATPLYFQPLKVGVDVSVHAATKYIGGHSDLLMGTVTSNERAWPQLRAAIHEYGLTTSADDCALALRGLRSMGARLVQHEANARALIAWFKQQPEVERVLFPADADDPGHALWRRDMSGACGLFGVLLKPGLAEARLHALVDAVTLFGRGYSWGGYESLLIPSFPERTVTAHPYSGRLFRVHAGLEDPRDLVADLERGFAALRRPG
ncbi:MAG: cystathionine beta-lyase [Betaproteobacteria bacterium]